MLGERRLADGQDCFKLADGPLLLGQKTEDKQATFLRERLEEVTGLACVLQEFFEPGRILDVRTQFDFD